MDHLSLKNDEDKSHDDGILLTRTVEIPPGRPNFTCENCFRILQSKGGKTNHQKKCKIKDPEVTVEVREKEEDSVLPPTTNYLTSQNAETSRYDANPTVIEEETFYWGERKGSEFTYDNLAYEQMVYWC